MKTEIKSLTDEELRSYVNANWVSPDYEEIERMAADLLALREAVREEVIPLVERDCNWELIARLHALLGP